LLLLLLLLLLMTGLEERRQVRDTIHAETGTSGPANRGTTSSSSDIWNT